MKKTKRFYLLMALLLILLMGMSGCSGGSSNTSGKAKGKNSSGKTQLTLGLWGTGNEIKREHVLVSAFMKTHPKIKVNLVYKSWDSYWTWLTAQASSKSMPDVFKMDPSYLPKYVQLGAMQNLDSLDKTSGYKLSDFSNTVLNDFKVNGKQYGLPRDANVIVFAYNKALFKKAGLSYPKGGMSWQQILKLAQKLTLDKNGNNATSPKFNPKKIVQWGLGIDPAGTADSVLEPQLWSNGARLLNKNHKVVLNTPKAMHVLNFFKDLTTKYHVNVSSAELKRVGGDPALDLASKKVAMGFTGSWNIDTLKQSINFGIMLPPKFKKEYTVMQPTAYCMSPNTPNKKAAWQLLSWLTGPKGQKVMASKGQAIPANKQAIAAFKKQGKKDSFNNQVFFDADQKSIPKPYYIHKDDLWFTYIPQKLEQPLNGKGSIKKAVQQISNLWNSKQ